LFTCGLRTDRPTNDGHIECPGSLADMTSLLTRQGTETPSATSTMGEGPDLGRLPQKSANRQAPPKRIALYVFLGPALLALSLIANGAWQARSRGNATVVAQKALARAIKKVPFEVRLPKTLPGNAVLVRVFLDEPDSDQGFQAYQLNVWYRTLDATVEGGGEAIHLWQTNDKFLARRLRDPVQWKGEPTTIGGEPWRKVTDNRVELQVVRTFSRRFDDGITMTVDSKDEGLARDVVSELAIVPAG
jgi:hypothetical protein